MSTRLPPVDGEWIDRSREVVFTFEGRRVRGLAGDTIASALWAADVRVLGRSFKYHRPRGVLSAANHDVNALMQWGARLNVRADVEPLVPGMSVEAVNTAGGVAADRMRILDRLGRFLPVGFYYKAFHRPKALAAFWERFFRRVTGLGRVDFTTPHIRTPKRYDHADVLVVGGGTLGSRGRPRGGPGRRDGRARGRERAPRRQPRPPAGRQRRIARALAGHGSRTARAAERVAARRDARRRLVHRSLDSARRRDAHDEAPRARRRRRGRGVRAACRVPQQRSAGRDARVGRAAPDLPPRREADADRRRARRPTPTAIARRSTCSRTASPSPPSSICAQPVNRPQPQTRSGRAAFAS